MRLVQINSLIPEFLAGNLVIACDDQGQRGVVNSVYPCQLLRDITEKLPRTTVFFFLMNFVYSERMTRISVLSDGLVHLGETDLPFTDTTRRHGSVRDWGQSVDPEASKY